MMNPTGTVTDRNMEIACESGQLTQAEEQLLARRWRKHADPRAIELLVHAHLGLVVRIASEFRGSGPLLEDLVQEGNLGLTIAARRFDPDRATRLATYATYWIRACILEHLVRTHGPVRVGTTRAQRRIFFGLGRARRRLERAGRSGHDTTALATELGVDLAELEAMVPRLLGRDPSLDEFLAEDDGRSLTDLMGVAENPEHVVGQQEEQGQRWMRFEAALRLLEPRERDILMARHLRARPETLAALGQRMGLSRERVRQLESRAKERMRQLCGPGRMRPHPRRRVGYTRG